MLVFRLRQPVDTPQIPLWNGLSRIRRIGRISGGLVRTSGMHNGCETRSRGETDIQWINYPHCPFHHLSVKSLRLGKAGEKKKAGWIERLNGWSEGKLVVMMMMTTMMMVIMMMMIMTIVTMTTTTTTTTCDDDNDDDDENDQPKQNKVDRIT